MNSLHHTYEGLLADVARLTGFSEIRGSWATMDWTVYTAPKLEKQVIGSIESGQECSLDEFPDPLKRLARGSFKDPLLMRYLRQLLLFSYKAEVPHDRSTTRAAFEQFFETNAATGRFGSGFATRSPRLLDAVRRHCQSVLYKCRFSAIKPGHGPGAVTTSKDVWKKVYQTIDSLYPDDWFTCYYNADHLSFREQADFDDIIEAKLVAVPKDSRGPRLICVHPAEAMWLQQGLRRELEKSISLTRWPLKAIWPRGRIKFDDQSINGRIALLSSRSKAYATLDMKEASDRISDVLVQCLFGQYYRYFGCCRAQRVVVDVRNTMHMHDVPNLSAAIHSYAPMGNATVFPIQSLVFWAICVASMQSRGYHSPGAAFVFGDDLVVPRSQARFVIDDLESFGLLVNRAKSFVDGDFRESCGVDAFRGVNVTPIRWKASPQAEQLADIQSLAQTAMRLRMAGYEEAASRTYLHIRLWLKRRGHELFFTNNPNHGAIAEFSKDSDAWSCAKWHRDYQRFVSPCARVKSVADSATLHGWNHVLESILSLERTAGGEVSPRLVSRRAVLNRGWTDII